MRITRITLILVTLIVGVGFWRLTQLLLQDIEAQTLQATEEVMIDTAHLIASLPLTHDQLREGLDQSQARRFEAQVYDLTKNEVGLGLYLTNADGIVLFDSEEDREGEDYSEFNDVYLTLSGRYGARSTREEPSDPRSSILYVGAPVLVDGEVAGVLSVYKAQSDGFAFIEGRKKSILWTTVLIGLGIGTLIGAVFWWVYRPVRKLTDYAQAIGQGRRPSMPKLGSGREVSTLGKALSEMREALEGRQYAERYVKTLTHELKSPLSAIRGAAELLDEDMERGDRERFLRNIRAECGRSQKIIDRLLALSELEGRTHLDQVEVVNLKSLIDDLAEEHQAAADLGNVKLETRGAGTVSGDPVMLRAAIENLLENAIGFSPEGGRVRLAIETVEEDRGVVVEDEGSGIPDYAQEKVFDRFFSIREADDPRPGAGLGLSFVKETAELHGGRVEASNRKGERGARVSMWLPRKPISGG